MTENKAIAIAEEMPVNDLAPARTYAIAELAKPEDNTFCSVNPELGADAKKLIYNASNNPTHKIDDFINKQIALKDLFVEIIEIADEDGTVEQAPRIVLIDDKGESYQCVSNGVWGSLKKMFAVYGAPTYEEPINVVVKQVKVKRGTMLTLEVA